MNIEGKHIKANKFRILAGMAVLLLFLFVVTVSGSDPGPVPEYTELAASARLKGTDFDREWTAVHNRQRTRLKEAMRSYFEKAIASGKIVGAGVSVVNGDKILFSGGFGKRDSRANLEVNGQTIFRLGSLSKGFAGVLSAKLKDEGKLEWEDPVSAYLPEFQLGDGKNRKEIRLAHLLSHTSGAPYHSYTNLVEAGLPLIDIAGRFKEVDPISSPGTMYSYQNALFALSAEIVHRATGQDLQTTLQHQLFNPLEMCSTLMDHEAMLASDNVALPHTKGRRRWIPRKINDHYYNAIAAGGINASPEDMGKWMRFLLGHNPEVMTKEAIREAFTPFIEIPGRMKYYHRWPGHVSSHYGFGWRIHKYREGGSQQERTIIHHGGSVNGFRNEIALFPEADLGICVLLNTNSRLARTVIPDLLAIVKDITEKEEPHIALQTPPAPLTPFSGSDGR